MGYPTVRKGVVTIISPFAGYERPYFDKWLSHLLDACRVRHDLTLLWMDNSRDEAFHEHLLRGAMTLPAPTQVRT